MNTNPKKSWRFIRLFMATWLVLGLLACDPLGDDDDDFDDDDAAVFGRIAGSSQAGFVDGEHDVARFSNPVNVEVAPLGGTVYVADFDNDAIRTINSNGVVGTLVNPTTLLPLTFSRPFGLTISPDGSLYVQTDGNSVGVRDSTTGTIWRVNQTTGAATVVCSNLGRPRGIQALDNNTLALSDLVANVITTLNLTTCAETLVAGAVAGTAGFVNATGAAARFSRPYGIALLANGSLLVADQDNNCLRAVTIPAGVVTTFAGICTTPGSTNGSVAAATFDHPQDVAISGANIYVSDQHNLVTSPPDKLIRRINGGTVFTQAGNGVKGFEDGEGTAASFFGLEGIALDSSGATLWIADGNNGNADPFNRVRRLSVP